MTFRPSHLFLALLVFLGGACDWVDLPFYWKSLEHPTYGFTVAYPRSWEVELSGLMGAAVVFRASEKDPSFRANVNIVVQNVGERSTTPKREAALSLEVLRAVMNEYTLLSQSTVRIGNIEGAEIRGKYRATEGERILRTVIGISDGKAYIFTFTCREEREVAFLPVVKRMLESFRAPGRA